MRVLLGAEYSILHNLGVLAEYGLAGRFRSYDSEERRQEDGVVVDEDRHESSTWALESMPVLFGVSLYF